MKYPKFHSTFSKLDKEWIVLEDVTKYLEKFVCYVWVCSRDRSQYG